MTKGVLHGMCSSAENYGFSCLVS